MSTMDLPWKNHLLNPMDPRSFDFPPPRGPFIMKRVALLPFSKSHSCQIEAKASLNFFGKRIVGSVSRRNEIGLFPNLVLIAGSELRATALNRLAASENFCLCDDV